MEDLTSCISRLTAANILSTLKCCELYLKRSQQNPTRNSEVFIVFIVTLSISKGQGCIEKSCWAHYPFPIKTMHTILKLGHLAGLHQIWHPHKSVKSSVIFMRNYFLSKKIFQLFYSLSTLSLLYVSYHDKKDNFPKLLTIL